MVWTDRPVALPPVRLGGSANLLDPFPAKPKGMHWRTYRHLRARAQDKFKRW
jgi:hypothetical protein